jgi:hypothetical protein
MGWKKMCLVSEENKKEIFYKLVNSFLTGFLVFMGSMTNGFSWDGVGYGFVASLIVAITKFKEYWDGEAEEYSTRLFNFVG